MARSQKTPQKISKTNHVIVRYPEKGEGIDVEVRVSLDYLRALLARAERKKDEVAGVGVINYGEGLHLIVNTEVSG